MAYPEDLLEQARHLARREPRRPKHASLRRALSTAYYALFHLLIEESTRNWKRPAQRPLLGRAFEHGQMRKARDKKLREIEQFLKNKPPPSQMLAHSRSLQVVAGTFVNLQQLRHLADYDDTRPWSRKEVIRHIADVEDAFQSLKTIRDEDSAQDFLITLLFGDR